MHCSTNTVLSGTWDLQLLDRNGCNGTAQRISSGLNCGSKDEHGDIDGESTTRDLVPSLGLASLSSPYQK